MAAIPYLLQRTVTSEDRESGQVPGDIWRRKARAVKFMMKASEMQRATQSNIRFSTKTHTHTHTTPNYYITYHQWYPQTRQHSTSPAIRGRRLDRRVLSGLSIIPKTRFSDMPDLCKTLGLDTCVSATTSDSSHHTAKGEPRNSKTRAREMYKEVCGGRAAQRAVHALGCAKIEQKKKLLFQYTAVRPNRSEL